MLPTSAGSWIFAGLAILCLIVWIVISIFALKFALHWCRISPNVKDTSAELSEINNAIRALTEVVKNDINERKNRCNYDG